MCRMDAPTYLAVSLPSRGAMAPPVKMLSPSPKSTEPVDKLDPEPCFCKLSEESYGMLAAEKGSDPAELLEDMNHVNVTKPIKAKTTVNVRCCRRAIFTVCNEDRRSIGYARKMPEERIYAQKLISKERMRCRRKGPQRKGAAKDVVMLGTATVH